MNLLHSVQDVMDLPIMGDVLLVIIPKNFKVHHTFNGISLIFLKDLSSNETYIINCSHNDIDKTLNLRSLRTKISGKSYVYNKSLIYKYLPNAVDLQLAYWMYYNDKLLIELTNQINIYYNWYPLKNDINDIIPIVEIVAYIKNIVSQVIFLCNENIPGLEFYNHYTKYFFQIEESKLKVDSSKFYSLFKKRTDYFLNSYNFFTATGRPSNSYNNINLAALDKANGIRSCILPNNDRFIEFDYEAMHVRLIANLIRSDLPSSNIHEYFGRLYFRSPVLGEEMYEKSKNYTFRQLYGTPLKELPEIKFFSEVELYRKKLWEDYQINGYIELPSGRRLAKENLEVEKMSKTKLFNYFIQALETEHNIILIEKIIKYLFKKDSKLVLYTYDSFLFDVLDGEMEDLIKSISSILNQDHFTTRIKHGINYQEMYEFK